MRRFAIAVALAVFAPAAPADCTYCSSIPCYGPCAGPDCVCLVRPETIGPGTCYGVNQAGALRVAGWKVLR